MARKRRYQPENVCYHVVTRVAHREFLFDDEEKRLIVEMICRVERFTGVQVLAYAVMSNHLHLLLFIEKPANLKSWEENLAWLGYDFERVKDGEQYHVSKNIVFSRSEVDEIRRVAALPVLDRYEMTVDELKSRMQAMMRDKAYDATMQVWEGLSAVELEEEYERQLARMYDLSAFMKILKQNISQLYNARHEHTGGLWEGRFRDSVIERSVDAMSSVATYIDLNAWRAKMCARPEDYHWCSFAAAVEGNAVRRAGYAFIYDTGADWSMVAAVHAEQLEKRMMQDNAEQAEKEDAVFSSGAIIGSGIFIDRIVRTEVEAFPNGHKSPPTAFSCGDTKLMALRRLEALR